MKITQVHIDVELEPGVCIIYELDASTGQVLSQHFSQCEF